MHFFVQLQSKLAASCNQPPAECVPGALSPRHKVCTLWGRPLSPI